MNMRAWLHVYKTLMTESRAVGVVGAVIVAICGLYEIWELSYALDQADPIVLANDELWARVYEDVFLKVSIVIVFTTRAALLVCARRISYVFVSAGWWIAALTGVTYIWLKMPGPWRSCDDKGICYEIYDATSYGTDFLAIGILLFIVFSGIRSVTTGIVAAMRPRFK